MPDRVPAPTVIRACARRTFPALRLALVVAVSACGGAGEPAAPTPPPPQPPPPAAIASITVSPSSVPLLVGATVNLSATPRDNAGNPLSGREITWSSSAVQVATVDGTGRVTGVTPGAATITATSGGQQGSASITVSAPPPAPVASVQVSAPAGPLVAEQTATLVATLRDVANTALTGRSIAWSSSAPSVADVNANGVVTARAPGNASITATSEGVAGTVALRVIDGGMVGAAGGTLTAFGGTISVAIPPGALPTATPIALVRNLAPPAHTGLLAGSAFDVATPTTTFAAPVTVTLRYDPTALPASASPLRFTVRRRGATSWDALPGGQLRLTPPTVSATTTAGGTVAIVSPIVFDVSTSGFENGVQGWTPSGNESVVATAAAARTGSGGLLVSNRSASWQGAGLNVLQLATPGAFHRYVVWVRLPVGSPDATLGLTMEWRGAGVPQSRFEAIVGNTRVTSGGWTKLEGTYALPSTATFARIKIASSSGTASYLLDDFDLARVEAPVQDNIPALKTVLAPHFKIGTSVTRGMIDTPHAALIRRHFNSITPGNEFKWDAVQATEGQFAFEGTDRWVDFAVQHGMQIRGHTFVWHSQAPAWLFQDAQGQPLTSSPAHKTLLMARLETHIRTIARRYGNRIAVWDVVNEVTDPAFPDGLRRSPWFNVLGKEYIDRAFIVAREELPNAKLVINDYNTDIPARREALYRVVADLKARGIPVDGVGHQMHNSFARPTPAQVETTLQRFIPLGVDQEITELDVTLYDDLTASWTEPPADRLVRQGQYYRDLFDVLRRFADNISTVTVWGPSDDDSWLNYAFVTRMDWPLLFDRQLQAKPAYWGIVDPTYLTAAPLSTRLLAPASAR